MNRLFQIYLLTAAVSLTSLPSSGQAPSSMPDTAYARAHDLAQITYFTGRDTLSHYAFDEAFHLIEEKKNGQHNLWSYENEILRAHETRSNGITFYKEFDDEGMQVYFRSTDGINETTQFVDTEAGVKHEETVSPEGCSYHLWDSDERLRYRVYERENGAWDVLVFDYDGDDETKWEITRNADGYTVLVKSFLNNCPTLLMDSLNGQFMLHLGDQYRWEHYTWDTQRGTSNFHIRNDTLQLIHELNDKGEFRRFEESRDNDFERRVEVVVDSLGQLLRLDSLWKSRRDHYFVTREHITFNRALDKIAWQHEVFNPDGASLWRKYRDLDSNITYRQKTKYFKWGVRKGMLKKQVTRQKEHKTQRIRLHKFDLNRLKFWRKQVLMDLPEMRPTAHHYDCMPRVNKYDLPRTVIIFRGASWENREVTEKAMVPEGVIFKGDSVDYDHEKLTELVHQIRYPAISREVGIQGKVFLGINGDGKVEELEILKSPHPTLDQAVLRELDILLGTKIESPPHRRVKMTTLTHAGKRKTRFYNFDLQLIIAVEFRLDN